jgi:UDP-N-acetylglucosamine 2-epimerase (non-hydrolysing)
VVLVITFVLGTRPEIIKLSPVIDAAASQNFEFQIIHTGQHYNPTMDGVFLDELSIPPISQNLNVGSSSQAKQTASMLVGLEKNFTEKDPGIVVVQGDTNTVLSAAICASKLHIPVAHVEAGLRSFDKRMPEEINRIITDHLSKYLFAPTQNSKKNLLNEGISERSIYLTGNTVVDAVYRNIKIAEKKSKILKNIGLKEGGYFLLTLHRQENVDDKAVFESILSGLGHLSDFGMPIIWPVHPRSSSRMREYGITPPDNIIDLDPVSYLDFLMLQKSARLILTDSGGVQEEACILKTPCVTLRESTERPETLEVGSNVLSGANSKSISLCANKMMDSSREWDNPFGDGKSSKRITNVLCR